MCEWFGAEWPFPPIHITFIFTLNMQQQHTYVPETERKKNYWCQMRIVFVKQTLKRLLFAWQMFESHKTLLKYICFFSPFSLSLFLPLAITLILYVCNIVLRWWLATSCKCKWLGALYMVRTEFSSRIDIELCVWRSKLTQALGRLIAHVYL